MTTMTTTTITTTTTNESLKLVKRLNFYFSRFGLPEVDKLNEEFREIVNTASNSNSNFVEFRKIVNTASNFADGDGDTEDHISRLSNDILQFIISLLTMREGAATSILSTRWRHLWSTSASHLTFKSLDLLGYKYPPDTIQDSLEEFDLSQTTKFVTRADQICQSRPRDLKMDRLDVNFLLTQDSAEHVDRWMELAAAQGVNKLILDCDLPARGNLTFRGGKKYIFPVERFGSSLNYLELILCALEFPPNFCGWGSLMFLSLCDCSLTANDVQNIVSNCPLQWLSLRCCAFPQHTILNFVGPSIQLKHLHIQDDWNFHIEKIKVQDVNLLSFEVDACDPSLSIENVPCLKRLVLYADGPAEIPDNLPCLETLFLNHEESELKMSTFNNLKRLMFTLDTRKSNLFEVFDFLDACPLLEQLELNLRVHTELEELEELEEELEELSSKISSRLGFSHHHLKEVHVYGFDSHSKIIELAKYLLENSTTLEKMILDPKSRSYEGNAFWRLSNKPVKLVGMPLEKVYSMLREKARLSTEILII